MVRNCGQGELGQQIDFLIRAIVRAYEALTGAAAIGRVLIPAAAPLPSLKSLRKTEQC